MLLNFTTPLLLCIGYHLTAAFHLPVTELASDSHPSVPTEKHTISLLTIPMARWPLSPAADADHPMQHKNEDAETLNVHICLFPLVTYVRSGRRDHSLSKGHDPSRSLHIANTAKAIPANPSYIHT